MEETLCVALYLGRALDHFLKDFGIREMFQAIMDLTAHLVLSQQSLCPV